jgi:hypothetical protein
VLSKTGLLQTLKESGHLTIFAPTDSAFKKLDPTVYSRLLQGEACIESKYFMYTYLEKLHEELYVCDLTPIHEYFENVLMHNLFTPLIVRFPAVFNTAKIQFGVSSQYHPGTILINYPARFVLV